MSEWQPIETAPKGWDAWILVGRGDGPYAGVWTARWYVNNRYQRDEHSPELYHAYWTDSNEEDHPATFDNEEDFLAAQPTHWMPLPDPPPSTRAALSMQTPDAEKGENG